MQEGRHPVENCRNYGNKPSFDYLKSSKERKCEEKVKCFYSCRREKRRLPNRKKWHKARSELSELSDTDTEKQTGVQETSARFIKKTKPGAATHAYKARKAEARGQSSIATWVRCKKRREAKRYLAGGKCGM